MASLATDTAAIVDDPSWDTQMASPEEEELLLKLKADLGDLLTTGKHSEFPEVVGHFNLLRFLRGCNREIPEAVKLFKKHIALRAEFNLDEVRQRMVKILDEKPLFGQEDLTHGSAWAEHFPNQLSAGENPSGHVIIYLPEGDHNTKNLMEALTVEQIWETKLEDLILRQIQMDRLSRKYNRLMKQVVIVDCAGASMANLNNKEWSAVDKDFSDRALTCTHVEFVGRIFLINAPMIVRTLYAMAKHAIPKRTRSRIFIHGHDYRKHIMDQISTRTLSALISFRKAKDTGGGNEMKGDNVTINAGKYREVLVEIDPQAGSTSASWKFEVHSKDIMFSVKFFRNSRSGESESSGTVTIPILAEQKVEKIGGPQSGEYKGSESGLLLLRWSNEHSWWYSNSISYEVEIAKGESANADGKLASQQES
jgi:hypothetical protein